MRHRIKKNILLIKTKKLSFIKTKNKILLIKKLKNIFLIHIHRVCLLKHKRPKTTKLTSVK